jgi:hypothetical protein
MTIPGLRLQVFNPGLPAVSSAEPSAPNSFRSDASLPPNCYEGFKTAGRRSLRLIVAHRLTMKIFLAIESEGFVGSSLPGIAIARAKRAGGPNEKSASVCVGLWLIIVR